MPTVQPAETGLPSHYLCCHRSVDLPRPGPAYTDRWTDGLFQMDKACRRRRETTGLVVEASETILKIDMQPLASSSLGLLSGCKDQLSSYAPTPRVCGHHRVLNPCVRKAVPDHVHKPDKSVCRPNGHPPQTVPGKLGSPVLLVGPEYFGLERLSM